MNAWMERDTFVVIISMSEASGIRDRIGMAQWLSVPAFHVVGCGSVPRPGHTKDHHKNGTNCLPA